MAAREVVTKSIADAAFRATAARAEPDDADPFRQGDTVVYPPHGLGVVDRIGNEVIAGHRLRLIQISFVENQMTLRLPVAQARAAGLRKLAAPEAFNEVFSLLGSGSAATKMPWIKRRQMYVEKINSGDPRSIAEVARDLHTSGSESGSHAQRSLFDLAVDRLAAELAAVTSSEKADARSRIDQALLQASADRKAALAEAAPPPPAVP